MRRTTTDFFRVQFVETESDRQGRVPRSVFCEGTDTPFSQQEQRMCLESQHQYINSRQWELQENRLRIVSPLKLRDERTSR
jgi:hypothetical protein